jgi:hypothetical protein
MAFELKRIAFGLDSERGSLKLLAGKKGSHMKSILSLILVLGFSSTVFAWGERGHHTICEVATRLVKTPELAEFLKGRLHVMGHACNLPDIQWRNLVPPQKIGDATHFLDPENLGYTIDTVPTDLKQIFADKEGKYSDLLKRNINVYEDLGTGWWRYDQFFRLAVADGASAKSMEADIAISKEQFNSAISSMIANMGIMGHFVGDASMPYHNTADYDGWSSGHGGIHGFYETKLVNEMNFNITTRVYDRANFLRKKTPTDLSISAVERVRKVSIDAFRDFKRIQKLDVVVTPSELKVNPDGTTTKVYAVRKEPKEVLKSFEPLIVNELAMSALALADTWDQIYAEAGKPNLKFYSSYAYPMTVDFVAPDYQTRTPASIKKGK